MCFRVADALTVFCFRRLFTLKSQKGQFVGVVPRAGGLLIFLHGRLRRAIDPCIPTMPGRSAPGFHRCGRHCLHQARSAVGYSASLMKDELHPTKKSCDADFSTLLLDTCNAGVRKNSNIASCWPNSYENAFCSCSLLSHLPRRALALSHDACSKHCLPGCDHAFETCETRHSLVTEKIQGNVVHSISNLSLFFFCFCLVYEAVTINSRDGTGCHFEITKTV